MRPAAAPLSRLERLLYCFIREELKKIAETTVRSDLPSGERRDLLLRLRVLHKLVLKMADGYYYRRQHHQ